MMSKKVILWVTALLSLASILTVAFFDLQSMRSMRFISAAGIFVLFIWLKGYKNVLLLLALFSFVCADYFLHFFETAVFAHITIFFKVLATIFLCLEILPHIIGLKYKMKKVILLFVLILLHIFLFYKLFHLAQSSSKDVLRNGLSFCYGIMQVFLTIMAFIYSYDYGTIKARYFAVSIYIILISNIITSLGYFLGFNILFYFSRPLYVLGLSILLLYSLMDFKKQEPLEI